MMFDSSELDFKGFGSMQEISLIYRLVWRVGIVVKLGMEYVGYGGECFDVE